MFFKQADNTRPDSLASRLRIKRMQLFFRLLEDFPEPVRVLDVGGTAALWQQTADLLPRRCEITLLNLVPTTAAGLPHIVATQGDARNLVGVGDRSFDVCFSNSVIEHVGTLYDQIAMAKEVQRVARAYFVQTPNRYFPIEPHFLVPCWQFLPVGFRAWLLQRRNLGWMKRAETALAARAQVEQIRLLTARELRWLFPQAELYREKLGPFTKSLVAWQRGR